jgi:NADPH2:quinone reductase
MADAMRQVCFERFGGPEVLHIAEVPRPDPAAGELRIRVTAAGVNRADLAQREGSYAPPPGASQVLGLEVSGTVDAVGSGVSTSWIGQSVCSLTAGGGYAEWVCVPATLCMAPPSGFDLLEAAAFPEVAMTVWSNVFELGRLRPGESLLVHGGTSGIGAFAIALARALGHQVLATAGDAIKCEAVRGWGAIAINHRSQDFVQEVLAQTNGRGVDVVLDMVGGSYVARNLSCLAMDGRVVQIAFLEGARAELDLMQLMRRRAVLTGSLLRPRSDDEKAAIVRALEEHVFPLIANRQLSRPVIDSVYPMEAAHAAHARMATSAHIGKLVLTWDSSLLRDAQH